VFTCSSYALSHVLCAAIRFPSVSYWKDFYTNSVLKVNNGKTSTKVTKKDDTLRSFAVGRKFLLFSCFHVHRSRQVRMQSKKVISIQDTSQRKYAREKDIPTCW
jgi:hypothetical protein